MCLFYIIFFFRKILNDLSSEPPASITVAKIEEESNGSTDGDSQDGTLTGTVAGVQYQQGTTFYF